MPQVSVVIPTFGRPELVCRAIRTVLRQTIEDLEVIVVIDGDDPPTREAIAALGDARVRTINHPEKRGAGQARDTGAAAAVSPWVAFLDDDDEWLPGKLAAQLSAAPDERSIIMTLSQVVSSRATFILPGAAYDASIPVDEWLFDRRTWAKGGESFLQTSSLMIPRALFATIGFTDTKQHEEWELVIRAVKEHGYKLITVREPLVIYYVPEQRRSLSRTYTWMESIKWALGMKDVLTARAFSGFCLTVVASMAATRGNREAFLPLLRNAVRHGAPTVKQLFAFAYFYLSSEEIRQRLRMVLWADRKAV